MGLSSPLQAAISCAQEAGRRRQAAEAELWVARTEATDTLRSARTDAEARLQVVRAEAQDVTRRLRHEADAAQRQLQVC